MSIWPRIALLALAGASLSLAGCAGGGGGDSATGPVLNTPPATNNAMLFHTTLDGSNLNTVAVDAKSPIAGSKISLGTPGTWSDATAKISSVPDAVRIAFKYAPVGSRIYARSVSVSVNGGVGDVAVSTMSGGTQYNVCSSPPGPHGCGDTNVFTENATLSQNGIPANTFVTDGTTPNTIRYQNLNLYTWVPDISYKGYLKDSYIGEYSDQSLTFTLIGLNGTTPIGAVVLSGENTGGSFFGGTATKTTDITNLKNTNVSATYQGGFIGNAGSLNSPPIDTDARSGLDRVFGDTEITANFGSGKVEGNVFNMQSGYSTTPLNYGLRVDGTISGTTYDGTAQYTPKATAAGMAGTSGTGQVLGGFFGAQAAETTGVIRVEGTQPGGGCAVANCIVQGAFGAKKQ